MQYGPRYAAAVLTAICLLLANGCGGDDAEEANEVGGNRDEEIHIVPPPKKGDRDFTLNQSGPPKRSVRFPRSSSSPDRNRRTRQQQNVDTTNLFEIADNAPNALAVSPDESEPQYQFEVVFPPGSGDSTAFEIVELGPLPVLGEPKPEFRLPEGFSAVTSAGYSDDGLPLRIVCSRDGKEMLLVAAGIGRLGTDDGPPEATPQLTLFLPAFYIDETEVTVRQFQQYRETMRQRRRSLPDSPLNESNGEEPAVGVSWRDARGYARWAGKDLPNEAEWEKAARGEDGLQHVWGNGRAIWRTARSRDQIDAVGSFPADRSVYGVLDLAGNAREWCLDFYSETAFAEAQSSRGVLRNWSGPSRPGRGDERVVKGNGPGWFAWHRAGRSGREHHEGVGFRCVLRVTQ